MYACRGFETPLYSEDGEMRSDGFEVGVGWCSMGIGIGAME